MNVNEIYEGVLNQLSDYIIVKNLSKDLRNKLTEE